MFKQSTNPTKPSAKSETGSELPEDEVQQDVSVEAEATSDTSVSSSGNDEWQGKYHLLQDQFTRLAADFENFRKRVREEQESLAKYGAQKTVLEILPVLDNLERATASLSEKSDPEVLFKSFGVVSKQLLDGMENLGVKRIQAVGQPFDPQYHEAVNQMPSEDFPENIIAFEAQKGYTLHDKVIRPAMVVVSTGSANGGAAGGAEKSGNSSEVEDSGENRGNPFLK